ncbi:MAG: formylglycine-generating enzyme family protein [Proteobacteria bacterium]|jgi:formylglycine-generating enzyme required for sulfatase activity|nr:formylglycine-generating enzyme family protein [Pseudomonadota bacterium]MCC6632716.1 formylglycine-generating enzyme family protein [Gammaproteobacteria bacterium]
MITSRGFGLGFLVVVAVLIAPVASAAGRQPKPGARIQECRNCPELVVLPAGTFLMGSPASEPERDPDEPQHRVTLTRSFAIATKAVTWNQWEACARDNWCEAEAIDIALRTNPDGTRIKDYRDHGRGNRPAVGMSWHDAQRFVGWLNWKTGSDDAYRLPSEAEWEYAARAGSSTAFPWGDAIDYDRGNFGMRGHGERGPYTEGKDVFGDETAPVGSFPPNAWGLHDMHGNVFEWTQDCYEADMAHAPVDGSASTEGDCSVRVFRNGTFTSNPYMQRSARRGAPYAATTRGRNYLGFRVAKTL